MCRPENDFFELVWESGQISSQGQSSRGRKSSPSCRSLPSHCLPSHSPRGREKDVGGGYGNNPKIGKFGDLESGLNEIPISVPSREVDEMMPWLDYSMDGSLQNEYGSNFLHELQVTENDIPASNNFTLFDKRSSGNQIFRDSNKNSAEPMNVSKGSSAEQVETARNKASTNQLYPPSSNQCQTSFVTVRSRDTDITENNNASKGNQDVPYGETSRIPSSSSDFSSLKAQKQDPKMCGNNGSNVMNFSHFARPAAIVRANLQNIGLKSGLISATARPDSIGIKNRGEASTSSNPPESTLVNSSGECSKEPEIRCQKAAVQSKADLKPLHPKSLETNAVASKQSEPVCKESGIKKDQPSNQVLGDGGAKVQTAAEKGMEAAAVASSSVCSGNGADRASDDPNRDLKRKSRDTDDSECHSEVS